MSARLQKTDTEWLEQLTPEQYKVCRQGGTERAFTGEYHDCKKAGMYCCICCGKPLFSSVAKFDSGTGWPSFWAPLKEDTVRIQEDNTLFMRRTEVVCSDCDAHLGHVFPDGPPPTSQRYCLNSVALDLREVE